MSQENQVYLLAWNDDPPKSLIATERLYPGCQLVILEKRDFRSRRFLDQLHRLWRLRGQALVFFFHSLDDINTPLLLGWSSLLHRCRHTVLLDEAGNKKVYGRWRWLGLLPITLVALILDACAFLHSLVILKFGLRRARPVILSRADVIDVDVAYLFPYPMSRYTIGGAMSHV